MLHSWRFSTLIILSFNMSSMAESNNFFFYIKTWIWVYVSIHAISLNISHIWVRSDCQVLVRAIDRKRGPAQLHGTLSYIVDLSSSFCFWFFSFVTRNCNGPTNSWGKACLNNCPSIPRPVWGPFNGSFKCFKKKRVCVSIHIYIYIFFY